MTQPPSPGGYTPRWPGERPFAGHGAPPYGFPAQGPAQHPMPEKKKAGCLKTALIVFGIFVVLFLILVVIAVIQDGTEDGTAVQNEETVEPSHEESPELAGDNPDDERENSDPEKDAQTGIEPEESPVEEPAGPTFQGMKDADMVAVPDEWLAKDRTGYNSLPLRHFSAYGTSLLCSTVAIANRGNDEISFSYFNWELQMPNGVIESPSLLDGGRPTLSGLAELAPGGDVHGDVCFEADPTTLPGEYIVLRDASTFFTTKRMAWVNYF